MKKKMTRLFTFLRMSLGVANPLARAAFTFLAILLIAPTGVWAQSSLNPQSYYTQLFVNNTGDPVRLTEEAATFNVVAGLADSSCVSFESSVSSGVFLRHSNAVIRAHRTNGTAFFANDATWCEVPGLTGSGVSYYSFNFPSYYMVITNDGGVVAQQPSGGDFNERATFGPPKVEIELTTTPAEPGTNGVFTVRQNVDIPIDTVVNLSVSGTATSGTDYTALPTSVTIPAGQTTATIELAVLDDTIVEIGGETVIVTLTSTNNGVTVASGAAATATIADKVFAVSGSCLDQSNVGLIGTPTMSDCAGMLIVNDAMLRAAGSNHSSLGGNALFGIPGPDGHTYTFENSSRNVFTGQVTNMGHLFFGSSFNGDIGYWDTSSVTRMNHMFMNASAFNQDIGDWNTSNVTTMRNMFSGSPFNQNIGGWNTSNVSDMYQMFSGSPFNQYIGDWITSNVSGMGGMFFFAEAFNQDISGWNTRNVTNMSLMFYGAKAFNQNIGGWNTSNVIDMGGMFLLAEAFNQDISGWNTARVRGMAQMFEEAAAFNQNISSWNTSSVTNVIRMFRNATAFNQDIGGWDTSNVTTMRNMFEGASAFDQDISNWCMSGVQSLPTNFADRAGFSTPSTQFPNWGVCARQIDVTSAPTVGESSVAFSTAPVITIQDDAGVTQSLDQRTEITASIASQPSGASAVLSGDTTVTAANGVATFSDLAIVGPGGNYTLRFVDSKGALPEQLIKESLKTLPVSA